MREKSGSGTRPLPIIEEDGAIPNHTDITTLYQTIAALDEQIATLNAQREQARTTLSALVEAQGGKVVLDGIATLEITRPAIVVSYDRAGLEDLVRKLVANGRAGIAEMIEKQRKESHRVGSLRITKVKAPAEDMVR